MQRISSLTCMRCLPSLSFRTDGLPLSKIHHAPFDAHLLGIDPDFENDGPMLELLKTMHGGKLHLPERENDLPDRDRLAMRFDVFRGYE